MVPRFPSIRQLVPPFPRQVKRAAGWLTAVIRQHFDAGPALAQH